MRNKLFFLFALFYSSLFAGWSTPKDIVNESAYSAAFDGHGNAIVVRASNSELVLDIRMLGSAVWKSRSLGKVSQLAAVEIGNDSKGDPHLFWVDKSEKVCRFFYLPLLKVARPQLLWYGPKAYESLELGLSEKGDLYCRMVASEDDAVAVLRNGSTRWDISQRSSTSDRQLQQYVATVDEFEQIQDNSQPSWSLDGDYLVVNVNPRGTRLAKPQKVPFSSSNILADSLRFDDQGQLRLCWYNEDIGKFWTDRTINFGTINKEGKLSVDSSLPLDGKTSYTAGSYHITPSGTHVAVFYDKKSVVSYRLDVKNKDKKIQQKVFSSGNSIDTVYTLPLNDTEVLILALDADKVESMIGNLSTENFNFQVLSDSANAAKEIQLKSCKECRLMATWLEVVGDTELLRVSIYE